eukprot:TRINITY_DN853_c0_g1_i6.p1 TRINITY_DN853_c0_g1~~TRINITY_DN853_c0_g1_i6.p1  ORF type:complete len:935 (-),score=209.41 TRINITY_DN853_c0_g1_i6:77-2881(-)
MTHSRTIICAYAFALALVFGAFVDAEKTQNVITAHIIPHSHCDPGWLLTFEEYYQEQVKVILSGVVTALQKDPNRRFIWSEISYFSRWYDEQSEATKDAWKALVRSGQIEFVGAGWVQNDEACTDHVAIISQLTAGHEYIMKHFGVKPRFAWQIDMFGLSSAMPTMLADSCYEGLVINRIWHRQKDDYKARKHMEFVWRGSRSREGDAELFTHILDSHYSAPYGFDWENGVPPITDRNVKARADEFVRQMKERSGWFLTNQLLIPFGDDFKFQQTEFQFSNMDKLMQYINSHSAEYGVELRYSTLAEFFTALHSTNQAFPVFKDDFFPYADNDDSWWTGYYTSRPVLKQSISTRQSVVHGAEATLAHALTTDQTTKLLDGSSLLAKIENGRRQTGLNQHHDAVTGTAKNYVNEDYLQRLTTATTDSADVLTASLNRLMNSQNNQSLGLTTDETTLLSIAEGKSGVVTVHNPLGFSRREYVKFTVSRADLQVLDVDGNIVPSEIVIGFDEKTVQLVFMADTPAYGYSTYFVETSRARVRPVFPVVATEQTAESLSIENDVISVSFSSTTGLLESVTFKNTGRTLQLKQQPMMYRTTAGGAYLFRPTGPAASISANPATLKFSRGRFIQEVEQTISSYAKQYVRVYNGQGDSELSKAIEITFVYGPIEGNTEVITRFTTDVKGSELFTDDNNFEMTARPYRTDKPLQGNYYPLVGSSFIKSTDLQFTAVVKSSHGVASLKDGEFEVMLHRRTLQDDGRGLGEPMNDQTTISDTIRFIYDDPVAAQISRRVHNLRHRNPLQTVFALTNDPLRFASQYAVRGSFINADLPSNVHLLTFAPRDVSQGTYLMRLQHLYEENDHPTWSKSATVDIATLFAPLRISEIKEVALTAAHDAGSCSRLSWNTGAITVVKDKDMTRDAVVVLEPTEIKTFLLSFSA